MFLVIESHANLISKRSSFLRGLAPSSNATKLPSFCETTTVEPHARAVHSTAVPKPYSVPISWVVYWTIIWLVVCFASWKMLPSCKIYSTNFNIIPKLGWKIKGNVNFPPIPRHFSNQNSCRRCICIRCSAGMAVAPWRCNRKMLHNMTKIWWIDQLITDLILSDHSIKISIQTDRLWSHDPKNLELPHVAAPCSALRWGWLPVMLRLMNQSPRYGRLVEVSATGLKHVETFGGMWILSMTYDGHRTWCLQSEECKYLRAWQTLASEQYSCILRSSY